MISEMRTGFIREGKGEGKTGLAPAVNNFRSLLPVAFRVGEPPIFILPTMATYKWQSSPLTYNYRQRSVKIWSRKTGGNTRVYPTGFIGTNFC